MPARRYRKQPRNFGEFTRRFGWSLEDPIRLLGFQGGNAAKYKQESASTLRPVILKDWARTYMQWFHEHSEKAHLFPVKKAIFHFWFAKGVRDAMGKKPRVLTIATWRAFRPDMEIPNTFDDSAGRRFNPKTKTFESLSRITPGPGTFRTISRGLQPLINRQIEKMGLKGKPVVVHDDAVYSGESLRRIARATGTHYRNIPVNDIIPGEMGDSRVPIDAKGKKESVRDRDIADKPLKRGIQKPNLAPFGTQKLTPRQQAYVKRALYAAGIAAAREVLAEEKNQKAP